MQRTLYDILDLPENANETAIRRAAAAARESVEADTSLSDKNRASALADIDRALRTLGTAATRETYDEKLHQHHLSTGSPTGLSGMLRSPLAWVGLAIFGIIIGGLYVSHEREQARERMERERIATEQREAQRQKEAQLQLEREKIRIAEEIRAQKEAEEQSHQKALSAQQDEMKTKQFTVDERLVQTQDPRLNYQVERADAWRRQAEGNQQRYEEEMDRRRAQAEVDRQRRYVEQREREEIEARLRRDAAARGSSR